MAITDGSNVIELWERTNTSLIENVWSPVRSVIEEQMRKNSRQKTLKLKEIAYDELLEIVKEAISKGDENNVEFKQLTDKTIKFIDNQDRRFINLNKLHEYSNLKYNWNFNGAEPFTKELINLAWQKISELEIQPKVFPTAADSIQFEYEKENGDYLEFNIFEDKTEILKIINKNEEEFDVSIDEDLNKIVNEFHG